MYENNIEIKKDIEILINTIKNNCDIKITDVLEELEKINENIKLYKNVKPNPITISKQSICTEQKLLSETKETNELLKQQEDRQKQILSNLEKNNCSGQNITK